MRWKNIVRDFLPPVLTRLLRPPPKGAVGLGYVSAAETLAAAQAADLTVSEYVERLWDQQGRAAGILQRLYEQGAVTSATRPIVEIGPGTGRYLEAALRLCRPERHQIYEPIRAGAIGLHRPIALRPAKLMGARSRAPKPLQLILFMLMACSSMCHS